jgi:hypothetical protein
MLVLGKRMSPTSWWRGWELLSYTFYSLFFPNPAPPTLSPFIRPATYNSQQEGSSSLSDSLVRTQQLIILCGPRVEGEVISLGAYVSALFTTFRHFCSRKLGFRCVKVSVQDVSCHFSSPSSAALYFSKASRISRASISNACDSFW